MDEKRAEEIQNQRYELIAPLVNRPRETVVRGERYVILRQIITGKYPDLIIPKGGIGLRTLERYLHLYETGGKEALKPKIRCRRRYIPLKYLEAAVGLKRENLSRSINLIIAMLEQSGQVPKDILKPSTVYEHFIKEKLTRACLSTKTGHYTLDMAPHTATRSSRVTSTTPSNCRTSTIPANTVKSIYSLGSTTLRG